MYLGTEYQCCRLTNKDTDMDREVPSQLTGQLDFGLRQRCGLHSRLVGKCVRACVRACLRCQSGPLSGAAYSVFSARRACFPAIPTSPPANQPRQQQLELHHFTTTRCCVHNRPVSCHACLADGSRWQVAAGHRPGSDCPELPYSLSGSHLSCRCRAYGVHTREV